MFVLSAGPPGLVVLPRRVNGPSPLQSNFSVVMKCISVAVRRLLSCLDFPDKMPLSAAPPHSPTHPLSYRLISSRRVGIGRAKEEERSRQRAISALTAVSFCKLIRFSVLTQSPLPPSSSSPHSLRFAPLVRVHLSLRHRERYLYSFLYDAPNTKLVKRETLQRPLNLRNQIDGNVEDSLNLSNIISSHIPVPWSE